MFIHKLVICKLNYTKDRDYCQFPYRWSIGVFWRKMKVKEEKAILIRRPIRSDNHSPHQIHSIFINSYVNPIWLPTCNC